MNVKAIYLVAVLLAGMTFAASGGIRASEKAIMAAEGKSAAPAARASSDVRIPFANSGGIRDWQPDGHEALFIQDAHGRWYRATLMGSCNDLPYSERIAFLTDGTGSLDKFSAVAVKGQRCQFNSLVPSAPPPSKAKRARHDSGG
jgi:hypothetical protein